MNRQVNRQVKPNAWSCSITALAMTLNIPVLEIIKEAGHDGGEIVFPLLKEPQCRKGYHSQELVKIALRHGFAMTPLELFPKVRAIDSTLEEFLWTETESQTRFTNIIHSTKGILEGRGITCYHTVHNDNGILYDPDLSGTIYPFSFQDCEAQGFYPFRLWVFTRFQT